MGKYLPVGIDSAFISSGIHIRTCNHLSIIRINAAPNHHALFGILFAVVGVGIDLGCFDNVKINQVAAQA